MKNVLVIGGEIEAYARNLFGREQKYVFDCVEYCLKNCVETIQERGKQVFFTEVVLKLK